MVDKLKQEIRIPVWAFTLAFSAIALMLSYTISLSMSLQQVKINTKEIEKLDNKVDKDTYKSDIQDIKSSLNSINAYLLTHNISEREKKN
jgi:hypothetical protein